MHVKFKSQTYIDGNGLAKKHITVYDDTRNTDPQGRSDF